MSAENVIAAVNSLRAQATALTNAVAVPLSTLQVYATQAAASAAAAAQSALDAANNSGGGGGGGSDVNTMLLKIKAAMAGAPATFAAIPRTSAVTITASTNKTVPAVFGSNYTRHWLTGSGGTGGSADLGTVTTRLFAPSHAPALGGGINFSTDDGSSVTEWYSSHGALTDYAGDWSGAFFGFTYTGRRFAFNHQSWSGASVMVDGNLVSAMGNGAEGYVTVDLGSTGTRNIVVRGNPDYWYSEFIAENGATMTPYNPLSGGKLKVAISGDSYMYTSMYAENNLSFPEAISMMIGGGHWVASAVGGTGFSSNAGDTSLRNAIHADRLALVNSYGADIIIGACSINDGWPSSVVKTLDTDGTTVINTTVSTTTAMQTWLTSVRTNNPSSVIVMITPWAPVESQGTNPSGTYIARRDAMATLLASTSGPWILLDGLTGRWTTSAGTNSGAGTGAWITGNGNTGAPNGSGNSDTWIGNDTVHPTAAGGIGLTGYIVSYIRAAIASMPTT